MYSDEVNLGGNNVMGLLYLAKKNMVPSLADKCMKYLRDNLDPSNVFSILLSAQKYEEKSLVDQCWKMIDEQTEDAVDSACFETIERSLLETIVKHDNLTIAEIELFKAVDLWATKECERQRLAADGKAKRRIIEEEIIKAIRFPIMGEKDFASVVLDSKILTKEEIVSVLKLRNSVPSATKEFSKTKRSGHIQRCCRFNSSYYRLQSTLASTLHSILFSVDRDIKLLGVCLFGNNDSTYSVELNVGVYGTGRVLMHKTGQISSELLQGRKITYFGFKVLFDNEPVLLQEKTNYFLEAKMTGPSSTRGDNGDEFVTCSGVTFRFSQMPRKGNKTTTKEGQFPELIFSRT